MKLAVLGSDKLVTTANAVLTEIFTGVIPDEIVILSEDHPSKSVEGIKELVSYFGVTPTVRTEVIGEGIEKWRQKVSEIEVDVTDITPGRKYMATSVYAYSKAKHVRYVYVKNESSGYRVFGYIPFNEIKVFDMRSGETVEWDPPMIARSHEKSVYLTNESLNALINIYSLLGKVKISLNRDSYTIEELVKYVHDSNDEEISICGFRSGFLRYREEKDLKENVEKGYFTVADTNVYIRLGFRLRYLTYSKTYGRRLLPSKATYNELNNKVTSTQKDKSIFKFNLAMATFNKLHPPPISVGNLGSGDIPLVKETVTLKSYLPESVVLVTADSSVNRLASSSNIKTVYLNIVEKARSGDIGEFLHCLSFYVDHNFEIKEIGIEVNDKIAMKIKKQDANKVLSEGLTEVQVVSENLNYASLLQTEEKLIRS
ncbi:hypothetical protein SUSAZ_08660 [Sulfolobus acidocaldarius SUSAZ]|nr:hypothetical protein SUSAZ_08660 [Sulfolobus acidocaldarius SUSAZ]